MTTECPISESQNNQATTQMLPVSPLSSSDEAIGQTFGRYKLLEKLGEGGFGSVWLAEQKEPVRRKAALKIIKLGMDTRAVVARFEAERQALAMMDHPNIAKVLDAGATETGRPYFAMELVRGIKITDYCDQNRLSTRERLDLFVKVCQAIQHAHQKGIVHRDIKPSNILVTLHDGVPVPKVIDFGIAKATQGELTDKTIHTQFHQFIGTPAYMSPEQAEMSGLDIDTRSDIYSLGVLLYELLVGRTPFDEKELMASGIDAMRKTIREREPMRPSTKVATLQGEELTSMAKRRSAETSRLLHLLKGDLDWIVMKCLEKDRTRRYETANGVAADLTRHLNNEPVTARPPSAAYRFQKMIRRNKAATISALAIFFALAAGLGFALSALLRERAARQRELAQTVRADTVAAFIQGLLSDVIPAMLKQGNSRGARELVEKADKLAASSLSNSPPTEIHVRNKLLRMLISAYDTSGALRQADIIVQLLPKVPDSQLPSPRAHLLLNLPVRRLWAAEANSAQEQKAVKELESLYADFLRRSPPARELAMICQAELALWHLTAGRLDQAEALCAEAWRLRPGKPEAPFWIYRLPALYARIISSRGNAALAENIAREGLRQSPAGGPEAREAYLELLTEFNNLLCKQDRFGEALQMLSTQRNVLADNAASQEELLRVDVMRGAVLARSGKASEALPIFLSLIKKQEAGIQVWFPAVILSLAEGDANAYRDLCRIGLLRYASSADGLMAFMLADGLLRGPSDEVTRSIAHGLVDRIAEARDWSKDYYPWISAFLAYREHRFEDGLNSMNRYLTGTQFGVFRLGSDRIPGWRAGHLYVRAILHSELGHPEEARHDFAEAGEYLKRALPVKPAQDRGPQWDSTYAAEAMREEAKLELTTKGIPVPESAPAKDPTRAPLPN